jgi:poly-gamma-glutamate capsule biosynthesis protein CapA/YwtB (metallophosphatase superfamily)
VRVALAGDTMLGRGVAERLGEVAPRALFAPAVVEAARSADLLVVNLECCISERGEPWPGRVFHFRAPPAAVEALTHLGVDCVTLANNHALDFGPEALLDTLTYVRDAGIAVVGAGADRDEARLSATLRAGEERLRVVAVSDHPKEYAASAAEPGIAYADIASGRAPPWVVDEIRSSPEPVIVSPHWGPNMVASPLPYVRETATGLLDDGAALVCGHSAHVFHGVGARVLFDLGDFVDDYRVDPLLRNDLGLLWFVDFAEGMPVRVEALSLKLEYCHTRPAEGKDAAWIAERFRVACAELGTEVVAGEDPGLLRVDLLDAVD